MEMMLKANTGYLAIFILLAAATSAISGVHEAHTHGQATLTLALEGNTVEIHLASPAANLVGFEHKAESAEQRKAVKKAETYLREPGQLFSFIGTQCQPGKITVNISGVLGDEQTDHHEHKDQNPPGHRNGSSHYDISARYRFLCDDPGELDSLAVSLFKLFPGIEKIDVMWVTDSEQGSELLNTARTSFSLRQ